MKATPFAGAVAADVLVRDGRLATSTSCTAGSTVVLSGALQDFRRRGRPSAPAAEPSIMIGTVGPRAAAHYAATPSTIDGQTVANSRVKSTV
jgi:hypothetical protein